jgi:formylglycine-generating enzyme required for sulfatase activity
MKLRYAVLILFLSLHSHPANGQTANNSTDANQPTATNATNEPPVPGTLFTNSVGMELTQVPNGFWAGKYEVTQKQYQKVMDANPSAFVSDSKPVDSVTWYEAVDFCKRMTELDLKKKKLPEGYYYTLPTEDEWTSLVDEAGLQDAVTSLNGVSRSETAFVGSLKPNSLGLYDVRGNVMEFCLSDESKPFRFLKGGSWQDSVEINLRPEFRWYCKPDERLNAFGFRCLLKAK